MALSEAEIQRYRMMAQRAREEEVSQWQLAVIAEGARVADVGCGPGATLVAMAQVVGPTGSVTGVDADPAAVSAATQMIAAAQATNATVLLGQADDSGLALGSFDVAVMRHVLAHNGGRETAIVHHLAELVRPGGCVYLVDVEMSAARLFNIDPALEDLQDQYVRLHKLRGNNTSIGLALSVLLESAGLEVLDFRGQYTILSAPAGMRPPSWAARDALIAAGLATEGDLQRWNAAFDRVDRSQIRPTSFIPVFTAIARRH